MKNISVRFLKKTARGSGLQKDAEATNQSNTLPRVSIVITSLNNEVTIDECLRSILDQDYPKQLLEVLVIDGGSTDSTVKHVKEHPLKLISNRLNTPASYNWALRTVKSEIVGFVDADAKVEKNWLKKLVAHLNDAKVAGAGGNIATWNNKKLIQRCIGYELSNRYSRLPKEVERLATMNLLLKEKVLKEVGGFDETLPTQYDTDLGFRIVKSGYKLIFDSDATCYHFHRPTLRKYFVQQYRYGQNTWKVYLKHPHLMKGDKITDWGMNIQPVLYALAAILLGLSLISPLTLVGLTLFLSLTTIITFYYMFSAAKISIKYQDASAMFLVWIYFTRAFAWTFGAATSILGSFLAKVGLKKN
jgi:cellulose synthase/poly-beta-1,6-N-acetylglucosamine synthase-like glycosyltransferase